MFANRSEMMQSEMRDKDEIGREHPFLHLKKKFAAVHQVSALYLNFKTFERKRF